MSTVGLQLPRSIHRRLQEIAQKEGVSINQFISSAVAEKIAAVLTVDYLDERARRGNRTAFERVLSKVPNEKPLPGDEIEE